MKKKPVSKAKKAAPRKAKQLLRETVSGAAICWDRVGVHKGRGVFARRPFKKGEVLEIAPVVPLSKKAIRHNGEPPDGYLLMWDEDTVGQEYCMPLGYIMLYNHSQTPNIKLESNFKKLTMTVKTLRPIKRGEELMWDYQCEIWFEQS
ncbi:MAG: SET domain-containing protein-lysine N-methyltransferase [Alphaproteobacteria bacterium]|nr:SET domain-containing protein-lysine N-methyltransferase [Alphaproteobacteria bacterium]